MKKLLKKYWKSLVIFIIVGIILIPFLIHCCFKAIAPCKFLVAEWAAGDVLSFYGVLIGSIATVWGVYLSIQYSRENYSEDVKKRVLPFMVLTTLHKFIKQSVFDYNSESDFEEEFQGYKEYALEKVFFVIENGVVTSYKSLSKEQKDKITHGGFAWEDRGAVKTLISFNLLSAPLILENVGNGVANLTRIGLNKKSDDESTFEFLTAIPFKVGQQMYIHIYGENLDDSNIGTYYLDVNYEDIYTNNYRQRYELTINKDNDRFIFSFCLDGHQKQSS